MLIINHISHWRVVILESSKMVCTHNDIIFGPHTEYQRLIEFVSEGDIC